jgi:purine-binding chemotaxis protein CheW
MTKTGGSYLIFRIGREEYGIEFLKVREIVTLVEIISLPLTAHHIRGVVNLRGKIIPVVDMRKRFGMTEAAAFQENCIITVMVAGRESKILVGVLVDGVNEVVQILPGQLEPVSSLGEDMPLDIADAIARTEGRTIILLDVDKLIGTDEVGSLDELERMTRNAQKALEKEGQ